jgi:RHS repeat-associated protein
VTTIASSWSITYDPNGNRTNLSLNGSPSVYNVEATSNRLASITNPARSFSYDNAGNTTSDNPNYTATYGLSGSLASITRAGITGTYTYDADKRRIRKVTSAGASSTIVFVYGLNGELLGEYDQNGTAIREYIWLDDIPVAMFMPDPAFADPASGAPLVFYIHADHLNAPRIVIDKNNATRWQWFAEPFGTTAPEANPSGLGVFTQSLRFPGQYADAESGLWYNYWRNYDNSKGGYTQSDPIGLAGGSRSTYIYVDGNPISFIDPKGTIVQALPLLVPVVIVGCYFSSGCMELFKPKPSTRPSDPDFPVPGKPGESLKPSPTNLDPGYVPGNWPPVPPPAAPVPERWPKDDKEHCIRLYALCQEYAWRGSCQRCLDICIAEKVWPFDLCDGAKCK